MKATLHATALFFMLILPTLPLFADSISDEKINAEEISVEETSVKKNTFVEGLHFSLEVFCRENNGHQGEYVYVKNSSGEKRLLSELIWEQTPIIDFGLSFTAGWKNIGLCLSCFGTLPLPCGKMEDSDWLNNEEDPDCSETLSSIKSHFTESFCRVESHYGFDAALSYKFHPSAQVAIKPFCSISYSYISLLAYGMDGAYAIKKADGTYSWWNDSSSNQKHQMDKSTNIIKLRRNVLSLWSGFELEVLPSEKTCFGFNFALSPFMYVESLDDHLLKSLSFYDLMKDFFPGVKTGLYGKYAISKKCKIGLETDLTCTSKIHGVSYTINSDSFYSNSNVSSASDFFDLSFKLSCTYHFKNAS